MPAAPPPLPTRFPCWCKAVYSWGGETKRDLGFIEGDLIEALNAGDGSWWMGRLKRDRRMVGLFPSNFVQVLPNYEPGSRSVSPLPSRHGSNVSTGAAAAPPQKQKSMFRKPFQAYAAAQSPNPAAAARQIQSKTGSLNGQTPTPPGSLSKRTPYSSMKTGGRSSLEQVAVPQTLQRPDDSTRFRAISPGPASRAHSKHTHSRSQPHVRARSPAPHRLSQEYRAPSPAPPIQQYRSHSPAPPLQEYRSHSPAPPIQQYRSRSPAPPRAYSPAPVQYQDPRVPSPAPQQYQAYSRGPSPAPYGPDSYSRGPSPAPFQQQSISRGPSPSPYQAYHPSRAPSPNPLFDQGSPPPPPPPAHRVIYNNARAPSPQPPQAYNTGYKTPNVRSTRPDDYEETGLTPSPLTTAMNDVMSSLQDMSVKRTPSPDPRAVTPDIWSPEAFGQSFAKPSKTHKSTGSLGITGLDSGYGSSSFEDVNETYHGADDEPPQLHNYVKRMESRLRHLQQQEKAQQGYQEEEAPRPPSKDDSLPGDMVPGPNSKLIRKRKSMYEVGKGMLDRTFTTKTNQTNTTNSSNSTDRSLMSTSSAGAVSATSAGSLARKRFGFGGSIRDKDLSRPQSVMTTRTTSRLGFMSASRPQTPSTGISYHSSHNSSRQGAQTAMENTRQGAQTAVEFERPSMVHQASDLGGLTTPKARKSGFFRRMKETVKTGAATARSTLATSRPGSPVKGMGSSTMTGFGGGSVVPVQSTVVSMGLGNQGNAVDWVAVRRDINRSNSLSKNERTERGERCQMLDIPVMDPIEELYATVEGDEGLDGLPVTQPTDFTSATNLALVDKSARFVQNIPPSTTPAALAQGYLCRPYRSDVQRLRAIFTWVAERVCWEEDFEGPADPRRVIQTKRGCTEEIAVLVMEMCNSLGIYCEVVKGYLKSPGEVVDYDMIARPNHWWNAVIVDGEWRLLDCSLANPSNPSRTLYSSSPSSTAESWWFLARPTEMCYTHVPLLPEQQHIVPPLAHEVLMSLPCACPPYFASGVQVVDFDTSLLHLDNLEMTHIHVEVPEDVECVAEVEARGFAQDADGDYFESGDIIKKKALAQPEWMGGRKRYTIKALLPGDEGQGILKIYAGKRGLMHSITSNPHPLALALPISHQGQNPPFDFVKLHPTPHAQRHDLYVAQPQCYRLAINNTFVFCVRQHPSSSVLSPMASNPRSASPNPFARPTSAMSMVSISASVTGSSYSNGSGSAAGGDKPAKLAIQSPAGKIIRLLRKNEVTTGGREASDGSAWETIIKVGERGMWRGLVLADRSARWCVFGEWECV